MSVTFVFFEKYLLNEVILFNAVSKDTFRPDYRRLSHCPFNVVYHLVDGERLLDIRVIYRKVFGVHLSICGLPLFNRSLPLLTHLERSWTLSSIFCRSIRGSRLTALTITACSKRKRAQSLDVQEFTLRMFLQS